MIDILMWIGGLSVMFIIIMLIFAALLGVKEAQKAIITLLTTAFFLGMGAVVTVYVSPILGKIVPALVKFIQ